MTEYLAETVRELLRDGAYVVNFTKVDGTSRKMVCTTKHDLIAEACGRDLTPGPLREKPKNEDLVTAFDLEIGQWRSFKASSLQSVEPFMENGVHVTEPL